MAKERNLCRSRYRRLESATVSLLLPDSQIRNSKIHFSDFGVSQELRLSNLAFLLTFMKGGRLFTVNAIYAIVRIRER